MSLNQITYSQFNLSEIDLRDINLIFDVQNNQIIITTNEQDKVFYIDGNNKVVTASLSSLIPSLSIDWSQLINIPQYFVYNGASKQYITNTDFQIGTIDNDKIYTDASFCFLGNNGGSVPNACVQFVLSSKNLVDNLITGSNIIDPVKLYSASTSDAVLCIDGATKQWLTSLPKSFLDNVLASNSIDVNTKLENAPGTYYFLGRYSGSTPAYFRVTTTAGFDALVDDYMVSNFKLIYPHSLFVGGPGFTESFTFFKNSSTSYSIIFSMFTGSYDQGCEITCIATSGTFANYFMQFDTKSASPITWAYSFRQNSAQIGYINRSTGAYVAVSDRKRKKNITSLKDEQNKQLLQEFKQIEFVNYNMNEDKEDDKKTYGIVAQDLDNLPLFSQCVQQAEGDQKFLDYTQFLCMCVQSLRLENQKLLQRLERLEKKISEIIKE